MRCPKCGYISFDHVETCLKCNKDVAKEGSKVVGTTYNVAPPAFLKFTQRTEDSSEDEGEILFDDDHDDIGIVDPDLDVLADDHDEGDGDGGSISFGDDMEGFGAFADEESFDVSSANDGSEDDDIDLGQFEDAFEEETPVEEDVDVALDIPDELAGITDLSDGPAERAEVEPELNEAFQDSPAVAEDPDDFGDLDLDLDLKDLNEDFNLTADSEEGEGQEDSNSDDLSDLSLDDLGLVEESKQPAAAPQAEKQTPKKEEQMDMDADLDFDLDLGGITLEEEE